MPEKAKIHSLDALAAFRIRLIQYVEKATTAIDEVSSDVRRTSLWLDDKQKPLWEQQVRKRRQILEEAQHENFSAKLSQFRESSDAKQLAVRRAKMALTEAEEKLRFVKTWGRRYPSDVEPLGRDVEKLRTVLDQDLRKASAYLDRILKVLEAYKATHGSAPLEETERVEDSEASNESSDDGEISKEQV